MTEPTSTPENRPHGQVRADFVLGILLIAGGVALYLYLGTLKPAAQTLPFLVVLGLVVGGLGLLAQSGLQLWRGRAKEARRAPIDRGSWAARTVALIRLDEIVTMLLISLYALALTQFGFLLASAAAMVVAAALLHLRRWPGWLLYALSFLLFSQWLFFDYLHLRDLGWSPW